MIWLLVLFFCANIVVRCEEEPVVRISSGNTRGYKSLSTNGNFYFGFRAIPYAKPPMNMRRFQPPEEVDDWPGVFDATQIGDECPQFEELTRGVIGNEDCLNINVYTPNLHESLPVMVWIHGGGFMVGAGLHSHYGPQNWMDHPIILVTFNYRLGILGFLNTQDSNSYGNYGMLDQVLALKWVQKNIRNFGGDPNRVTIFGESAGSVSVTYHLLSNMSRGLFHRAICQSGTALNHWALQRNPLHLASQLASRLFCPINSSELMINCLKNKPANKLIRESRDMQVSFLLPMMWAPSIESPGGPGFLVEDPFKAMEAGKIVNKVPVILGMTQSEGHFFYLDLSSSFPTVVGRGYFARNIPTHLSMFTPVEPHMSHAIREIAQHYYADANLDDLTVFGNVFTKVMGDSMFAAGISKTAEILSKAGLPTYCYLFNYYGKHCLAEYIGNKCGNYVTHGDELFLQFRFLFAQVDPMTENDAQMASTINSLWAAFANFKDLTLNDAEKWPTYNTNRGYVELNLKPHVKHGLLTDKMNLWTRDLPDLINNRVHKDEL